MIKARLLVEKIKPYRESTEAVIITGMRRTGKTTLLKYIYETTDSENKLFLDLEQPLNRKYFEGDNYERIKYSLEILGLNFSVRPYIFLDEIQFSRNLPSVVKYLIDHHNVKFFLTGSASYYLKNLFAESLSGRKFLFELFPLTFREFLVFKDSPLKLPEKAEKVSKAIFEKIGLLYDEYIEFGGFPGVVLKKSPDEKKKALEDIFSSFFQLEVLQLGDFRRNDVIRDLMLLLMEQTGSKLDIQKLSKELGISRPTSKEYIAFLEGTYFIKTINPFSKGRSSEIRKTPKVYLCDTGLANHLARIDRGALFENTVFQCLRVGHELNYYQKKSGREIDFIIDKEKAYEVKLTPSLPDLRKLRKTADEIGINQCMIVSRNYSEIESLLYGFMV